MTTDVESLYVGGLIVTPTLLSWGWELQTWDEFLANLERLIKCLIKCKKSGQIEI